MLVGIWRAFAVADPEFSAIQKYNIMRLVSGSRSFFAYFLFRFLATLSLILILSVCGIRLFTACLAFAAIFIYAYMSAYFIGAIFILAKAAALPLALLGLIPFLILYIFIFAFYISHIICFAARMRLQFFRDFFYYLGCIKKPFFIALFICLIAALFDAILVSLLTIGLVI